jgi:hypothetical protein
MIKPKWKILAKGVEHTTCEFTGKIDYCYQVQLLESGKLMEVNKKDAKKYGVKTSKKS